jgi:hypothetical protein
MSKFPILAKINESDGARSFKNKIKIPKNHPVSVAGVSSMGAKIVVGL